MTTAPEDPNGLREALARAEAERDEALERMRMFAEAYLVSAETSDIVVDRARAAEAEITRLRDGMKALERAATTLVEAERAEAEAEAVCEAAHAAVLDAVNASVGAEGLRKLLHANREATTARSTTLAPRQRAQEAAFSLLRSLATLSPKEQP